MVREQTGLELTGEACGIAVDEGFFAAFHLKNRAKKTFKNFYFSLDIIYYHSNITIIILLL